MYPNIPPTTARLIDLLQEDEPTTMSPPAPSKSVAPPTRVLFPPQSRLNPLTDSEKELHDILVWTSLEPLRAADIDTILKIVYASTPKKSRKLVGLLNINHNNSRTNNNKRGKEAEEAEDDNAAYHADTCAELLSYFNATLASRRQELDRTAAGAAGDHSSANRAVQELCISLAWAARDIAAASRTENLSPRAQFTWFALQTREIMAGFQKMGFARWEEWCFVRARRQEKYLWDVDTGVGVGVKMQLGRVWEEVDLEYGKVWEDVL
ncbi:MAG: hypothetical protein Q9201_005008 [Fulgogasparrea decipioides]